MRENIEKMEQFAFDGPVFHAMTDQRENLSRETWGGRKFAAVDFKQAVAELKATKFKVSPFASHG